MYREVVSQPIVIQFDQPVQAVLVTAWTEERTTLLISRWEAGCSAQEIADEIGFTRNAVIGKADRMKLQRHIDNVFWSDEDVETLKRMWGLRYTAKDIAAQIHRRGDAGPLITRSSVLTKANRIGLKPRERGERRNQQ